jgi:hypothetical protein
MAKPREVLEMLIPNGGWILRGSNYSDIEFLECEPITEEQFLKGFNEYDDWKAKNEAELAVKKQAILEKLGITEQEAKILLS